MAYLFLAWFVLSVIYTIVWFKVDHQIPDKENGIYDNFILTILVCLPTLIIAILFFVSWNVLERLFKKTVK